MGRPRIGLEPLTSAERMKRLRKRKRGEPVPTPPTDAQKLAQLQRKARKLEEQLSSWRSSHFSELAALMAENKMLKDKLAKYENPRSDPGALFSPARHGLD